MKQIKDFTLFNISAGGCVDGMSGEERHNLFINQADEAIDEEEGK